MGYGKNTSPVTRAWFDKATKLLPGETLYIACDDMRHAESLKYQLYQERHHYAKTQPIDADQLTFSPIMDNNLPWVKATRRKTPGTKGYKRDSAGVLKPVELDNIGGSTDRQIRLMLEDGLSKEQIEDNLERSLTNEEVLKYYGDKNNKNR